MYKDDKEINGYGFEVGVPVQKNQLQMNLKLHNLTFSAIEDHKTFWWFFG